MNDDDLLRPVDIDLGDYEDDGEASLGNVREPAEEAKDAAQPSNPAPSIEELDAALSQPQSQEPSAEVEMTSQSQQNPPPMPEPEESVQPIDVSAPVAPPMPPPASVNPNVPPVMPAAPTLPEDENKTVEVSEQAPVEPFQPEPLSTDTASEEEPAEQTNNANRIQIGQQINLTRTDPGLKRILIGMGWDAKVFADDTTPDLDVSIFLLNREDMTRENEDFVFYNNMEACDGGVQHHGDNRTGAGDGDDENITLTLSEIPFDIVKIEVVLSIYQGLEKEQSFSDVENIFFRLVNADTTIELFRLELDRIVGGEKAVGVKIGYFLREGPNWFFEAEATPVARGLEECATEYGIVVAELV